MLHLHGFKCYAQKLLPLYQWDRGVSSIPSHRGYLVKAALATDDSMAALCFWVRSSTAFFTIPVLLLPPWLLYSWCHLAHSSLRDCSVTTIIRSSCSWFLSEQLSQGQILFGLIFDFERFSAVLICRARACLLPRRIQVNLLSMQSMGILQISGYMRNQLCRDLNA